MKIQNVEVALRLFECGPGWRIVSFESPTKLEVVFRLVHVDGYAEEMAVAHQELYDNPVGIMAMIREWMKQRTFAGVAETKPIVKVEKPAVLPAPTPLPVPEKREPVAATSLKPGRTRLITLED